jgi:hypothetical protein
MGGTLEPDETPGGGLTMTLSLPAAPRPAVSVRQDHDGETYPDAARAEEMS